VMSPSRAGAAGPWWVRRIGKPGLAPGFSFGGNAGLCVEDGCARQAIRTLRLASTPGVRG